MDMQKLIDNGFGDVVQSVHAGRYVPKEIMEPLGRDDFEAAEAARQNLQAASFAEHAVDGLFEMIDRNVSLEEAVELGVEATIRLYLDEVPSEDDIVGPYHDIVTRMDDDQRKEFRTTLREQVALETVEAAVRYNKMDSKNRLHDADDLEAVAGESQMLIDRLDSYKPFVSSDGASEIEAAKETCKETLERVKDRIEAKREGRIL